VNYSPAVVVDAVTADDLTGCAPLTTTLHATAHTSASATYCTPVYTNADGTDFINNVTIKDATGTTTLWTNNQLFIPLPGYLDNTSVPTITLTAGTTYRFFVSINNGGFTEQVGVFADYNQDGTLNGVNETLVPSTSLASGTSTEVSFTVPAGAYNGTVRLRAVDQFSTAATPCPTSGFGGAADYAFTISGGVNNPSLVLNYAWSPSSNLNSTTIASPTATGLTAGPHVYTVTVSNGAGCTATGSVTITPTTCTSGFDLDMDLFLEGRYLSPGTSDPMDGGGNGGCLYVNGFSADPFDADSIKITLIDSTILDANPGDYVISAALEVTGVVRTNGSMLITGLSSSLVGNKYYIKVTHYNHLETWSAHPVMITSPVTSYSFVTDWSQAYEFDGNPFHGEKQMSDGNWAIYSGDLNQDNFIDIFDNTTLTDGFVLEFGYGAPDINGDGFFDIFDITGLTTNQSLFGGIYSQHP
jgi:hypothetical protein